MARLVCWSISPISIEEMLASTTSAFYEDGSLVTLDDCPRHYTEWSRWFEYPIGFLGGRAAKGPRFPPGHGYHRRFVG